MRRRASGVLLHITSLPSPFGIGDMGPWAYRFGDFLAEAKQTFWQILPLTPMGSRATGSPYHGSSAFAGNPVLISPELLLQDGLLGEEDLGTVPGFPSRRVDFQAVTAYKDQLLLKAYERFQGRKNDYASEYEEFCSQNRFWLDDFALFMALKSHFGGKAWAGWPREIRDRQPDALRSAKSDLSIAVEREKFYQFFFFRQWTDLKNHYNRRKIRIIGDVPIYVDHDSAELWVHSELFKLDSEKRPSAVAGVPPDYFSETGQLWGNPLYRWDVLKEKGYAWWVQRIAHNLKLFDFVRIDHFRGLVAYWEVPAGEETAINGRWVKAPASDFLSELMKRIPSLPIIAEDLGIITPDVQEIMRRFELPGMKVLLFAFGEDNPMNPYLPHNLVKNCVAYTGTHDNNTVKGWFEEEATDLDKKRLFRYVGREVPSEQIHLEMIRLVMMSVADVAIFPMQDILGLGAEARMNRPASREGNWKWRLLPGQLASEVVGKFREMTELYGRC